MLFFILPVLLLSFQTGRSFIPSSSICLKKRGVALHRITFTGGVLLSGSVYLLELGGRGAANPTEDKRVGKDDDDDVVVVVFSFDKEMCLRGALPACRHPPPDLYSLLSS